MCFSSSWRRKANAMPLSLRSSMMRLEVFFAKFFRKPLQVYFVFYEIWDMKLKKSLKDLETSENEQGYDAKKGNEVLDLCLGWMRPHKVQKFRCRSSLLKFEIQFACLFMFCSHFLVLGIPSLSSSSHRPHRQVRHLQERLKAVFDRSSTKPKMDHHQKESGTR